MNALFVKKEKFTKTDITSFYFKVDPMPRYIAGQFTELVLKDVGKHWFTISTAPGSEYIRITTRLTGSDFKNALDSLEEGSKVYLAEPMGDFVLPLDSSIPILMVAGGIGVTPYLSILEDQYSQPSSRNLNLIYSSKSEDDFVDLSKYQTMLSSFKKIVGPLTSEAILKEASKLKSPYLYISGPEPLVEKLINEIKAADFPDQQLVADYFPGYS